MTAKRGNAFIPLYRMIYRRIYSIVFFVLCVTTPLLAIGEDGVTPLGNERKPLKNRLSINILSLSLQNVSVKLERSVTSWASARVHAGFMPSHDIEIISKSKGASTKVENTLKGWHIKPEFVCYPSATNEPQGYYVGIYGKTDRYQLAFPSNKGGVQREISGGITRFGCGVMFGYQWVIKDVISIDWNFLGLGLDAYYFDLVVKSDDKSDILTKEEARDLQDDLNDNGLFGKFKVESINSSTKITSPAIALPNFRFGLSIGYAF